MPTSQTTTHLSSWGPRGSIISQTTVAPIISICFIKAKGHFLMRKQWKVCDPPTEVDNPSFLAVTSGHTSHSCDIFDIFVLMTLVYGVREAMRLRRWCTSDYKLVFHRGLSTEKADWDIFLHMKLMHHCWNCQRGGDTHYVWVLRLVVGGFVFFSFVWKVPIDRIRLNAYIQWGCSAFTTAFSDFPTHPEENIPLWDWNLWESGVTA